jgi:hypothetical protein
MNRLRLLVAFLLLFFLPTAVLFGKGQRKIKELEKLPQVLWENPGNIRARNLRYGPGSRALAPRPPFVFKKERKRGTQPKFEVIDARKVRWVVKLGQEAQPETVAVRLMWAVGYFADEAYYYDRVRIENLPRLSRGQQYVEGQNIVRGARFKPHRKGVERGEHWHWNKNPFVGTRELDGLKVLMILLNNFDARHENNHILVTRSRKRQRMEARYVATDVGSTLGRARGIGDRASKNNLEDYLAAKFVTGVKDGFVKFDYQTHPAGVGLLLILYPPYYYGEANREKIMQGIPIAHARWIGSMLARLTNKQLDDAFRAANYDKATRSAYVKALRERINQLARL